MNTTTTIDLFSFQTLDHDLLGTVSGGYQWKRAFDNGNRFGQAGAFLGGVVGLVGGPAGVGVGAAVGGAVGFAGGAGYDLGAQDRERSMQHR